MKKKDILSLNRYFPEDYLKITNIIDGKDKIIIKLKSITSECKCPRCGAILNDYHGTYTRKVQDLPILGKNVQLLITVREYKCQNEKCDVTTITESFNGFLNAYERMTVRCSDFICTLALETSCEGSARICKAMNIRVSGDTVIRLLTRRFELQEEPICGSIIGIDYFAFKKRNRYGTIIVDEATHKPIAILDGRYGRSLKEWLEQNKHVKAVTRDRSTAYATAISEVLPDAMQIADRFHLHQNLLEAIRKSLNSLIPSTIKIPKDIDVHNISIPVPEVIEDISKKNAKDCG